MSKTLSLLIPVFNEGPHLEFFFRMLTNVKMPCAVEYIIVDDCSTDNSWEIIEQFAKTRSDCVIYRQDINRGKGSAIHKALSLATGDIIIVQDADFEYDPHDIAVLIQPIIDDRADVVYGSRFHKNRSQVHRTLHYLVNRFLTLLSNVFSGLYLSDMETCYKAFRAEILRGLVLKSPRFGFEPEVTAKIAKLKLRVHEYPIHYFPRNYLEGKKITWKDGVAAMWFILKFNLEKREQQITDKLPRRYVPGSRQWL